MSKANEVPRLTRAHQVAIRDEARRLSDWHGRTVSPQELLDRLLGDEGLGSMWECYASDDDAPYANREARRIASLAALRQRDPSAFDRAMASQELQDLGHFVAIGHKDPVAATEKNARGRLAQVLAHSVAA